ncbi:MAG: hypothetical protein ACR2QQ_12695, partial [Gammaproteobacteria bacterium]
ESIFAADMRGDVSTFRQNLQLEYVNRLIRILDNDDYDYPSQSMALYQLREIEDMMDSKRRGNTETRAHTQSILYVIERALNNDA